MQKGKPYTIHYNTTRVPTNRDVDVQNISTKMKMHDRWLDTTITPLEVIGVSTPQNNDDACPVSLIYIEIQYQPQYVQKRLYPQNAWKIRTEPHKKLEDTKSQGIPTYT